MSHINPDNTDIGTGQKHNPELLHLYAGPSFHMEGYIVGNRAGLERLRDAINKALEGDGNHNASVTRGGVKPHPDRVAPLCRE